MCIKEAPRIEIGAWFIFEHLQFYNSSCFETTPAAKNINIALEKQTNSSHMEKRCSCSPH